MKFNIQIIAALPIILIVIFNSGCQNDSVSEPTKDTEKPIVSILFPVLGSFINADTTYTLIASASDNIKITKVDFYINGQYICSDSLSPYEYQWSTQGLTDSAMIMVKAYDEIGNIGTSVVITVRIKGRPIDYWPMLTGNTWTFNYSSYFRDWGSYAIGRAFDGTYSGTLTWEIISTTQISGEFRSTFKQRFVGVGTETRYGSTNSGIYDIITYNIIDSTYNFDMTIGSDQIIRLSANAYPLWQYGGALPIAFQQLDVYRFPTITRDSITTYSTYFNDYSVTLARRVGPIKIKSHYVGNTYRRVLDAILISHN